MFRMREQLDTFVNQIHRLSIEPLGRRLADPLAP
jgi:hypothetical protein